MMPSKKCLAFGVSIMAIFSSYSTAHKQSPKGKKADLVPQNISNRSISRLIVANHVSNSFKNEGGKNMLGLLQGGGGTTSEIKVHHEIDPEADTILTIIDTRIKVPKNRIELPTFSSGAKPFLHRLLIAHNEAKKRNQASDGDCIKVDDYSWLREKKCGSDKPMLETMLEEESSEDETTPKSDEAQKGNGEIEETEDEPEITRSIIIGKTIMPKDVFDEIALKWSPQPPLGFYN